MNRVVKKVLTLLFIMSSSYISSQVLDLTGEWDFSIIDADQDWNTDEIPKEDAIWEKAKIPCAYWYIKGKDSEKNNQLKSAKGIWTKRSFVLTKEQADKDAFFKWELIRFAFAAYINGTKIGETEYYHPDGFAIPENLLKEGENTIEIKIKAWNALNKTGMRNEPVFPIGASRFAWGYKGCGAIEGYIEIEFFNDTRINRALIEPDINNDNVTIHLVCESKKPDDKITSTITITDKQGNKIGETSHSFVPSEKPELIKVDLSSYKLWSVNTPVLYDAHIKIETDKLCDEKTFTFGMSSFESRDGGFYFNNQPITLLGSNIIGDWRQFFNDKKGLIEYLEKAKSMNVTVLRTHTLPPVRFFMDVCDSIGMMILSEMPMTYNYQPLGFNKEDAELYHKRAVKVAEEYTKELANHPAIIMWVSTNEPIGDMYFNQAEWDLNVLIPAIKAIDPTRPVMRSGAGTEDLLDIHDYAGWWEGANGDYDEDIIYAYNKRKSTLPIMNDEYLAFGNSMPERWLGISIFDPETGEKNEENMEKWLLFSAETGAMRQTEILRRIGYNGVLPFMLRGWLRGDLREDAPSYDYASLRCALAPVAVSVDLDDWHYVSGTTEKVDVWLINDSNEDADAELNVYLCKGNPLFSVSPETYEKAEKVFTKKVNIEKRSRGPLAIEVTLPSAKGNYWLVGLLEEDGKQAVMSQRRMEIYADPVVPEKAQQRSFHFIGNEAQAEKWMMQRNLKGTAVVPAFKGIQDQGTTDMEISSSGDVLVVWEDLQYSRENLHVMDMINDFLRKGKKVIIMRQRGWKSADWHWQPSLPAGPNIDYSVAPNRATAMLRVPQKGDEAIWNGIKKEDVLRFNGIYNAICYEYFNIFPTLEEPPGLLGPKGVEPSSDKAVIIESENVVSSNFVNDKYDICFNRKTDDGLVQREFQLQRGGKASLLSTEKAPEGEYSETYSFKVDEPIEGVLWTFEQGRTWATPFSWNFSNGQSGFASTAIPKIAGNKMADADSKPPYFAWSRLGEVSFEPGEYTLEVSVTKPKSNGHYLLSQDCFMIVPKSGKGEILAKSGDEKPILARFKIGEGELIISQLILSERLLKESPSYDPVAEQFMLNLLAY